jgi:hypothetical protein
MGLADSMNDGAFRAVHYVLSLVLSSGLRTRIL